MSNVFEEIAIRTTKAQTKEVFVDVNDLIIKLMLIEQDASSPAVKDFIKNLIKDLTEIRKKGHKQDMQD